MKTKYQRMSKEEKKQLLNEYKNTKNGSYVLKKLRNVLIYGIILYIYAIYLLVTAEKIWNYIAAGGLFIVACIFVFMSVKLRIKNLTTFAVKKK